MNSSSHILQRSKKSGHGIASSSAGSIGLFIQISGGVDYMLLCVSLFLHDYSAGESQRPITHINPSRRAWRPSQAPAVPERYPPTETGVVGGRGVFRRSYLKKNMTLPPTTDSSYQPGGEVPKDLAHLKTVAAMDPTDEEKILNLHFHWKKNRDLPQKRHRRDVPNRHRQDNQIRRSASLFLRRNRRMKGDSII